jgi:D-alanyl-D-alanine carboxypeptidase/D-alanyl-D-alanine-endopeptidase (penicillin-binding protein 4)
MTQKSRATKPLRRVRFVVLTALAAASFHPRLVSRANAQANDAIPSSSSSNPPSSRAATNAPPIEDRLAATIRSAHLPHARIGVSVVDASSGRVVFERDAAESFNPASNTKLVTAAVALSVLGPDHRYTTALAGRVDGRNVRGGIVLRGGGDPSLRTTDLYALARQLAARGIDRVEGGVIVDDRAFGSEHLPPAFEQQPRENAPFRAAVSAASIDENAITLHVSPALTSGANAFVTLDPPGYADLEGTIQSVTGVRATVSFDARPIANGRERVHVGGQIPLDAAPGAYRRRLENPSVACGHALRAMLEAAGIRVSGEVRVDPNVDARPVLASHESAPLSALLYEVGKDSNNFYAEMTLLAIGAADHPPSVTFTHAAEREMQWLRDQGIDTSGVILRNGSGLFDSNRLSPRVLTGVLRAAWRAPAIRDEYVAQLAVAGDDGTLAHRIDVDGAERWVRAKTGTLDDAIALSGFVLSRDAGRTYVFSVLTNGVRGSQAEARRLADRIARELVSEQMR